MPYDPHPYAHGPAGPFSEAFIEPYSERSGLQNATPWRETVAATAQVDASCHVDRPCHIGEHTAVLGFSRIMAHALIGDHCHIGHHVTIGQGVLIGHHVTVMQNAFLNSGVILENDVYCGHSAVFAPLRRIRARSAETASKVAPTLVRRGVSIGPNSTIAAGSTLGQFAFIEAGSVIDSNVPDFALVCGNPYRIEGWRCVCGELLDDTATQMTCDTCGREYQQQTAQRVVCVNPLSSEGSREDISSLADPLMGRHHDHRYLNA
jgi:UDP-2-acetamido-3-amino-2,3-dideoxy-glucuronate N-acetyltransferase